jgi:hypothetical protein
MSLSLITDTAAEVHRLTIAGSALAAGDFRLRKLLPQLESLGAKAPVFTRIAQGVKAVTEESDAAKAGRALLDLSTLLTAIQYTQSQHGVDAEFTPINTAVQSWTPTLAGYRSLAAVVEALTSTGEGRLEIVRDAAQRGLFKDLRLMQPAITALSDRFGELADFVAEKAIPHFGPVVVPLLKSGFDPKGGNPHARRLRALCAVDKEEGRAFCRAALEEARKEVMIAVIAGITGSEQDLETIIELTKQRGKDVRHAALRALHGITHSNAVNTLRKAYDSDDAEVALEVAVKSSSAALPPEIFERACGMIASIKKTDSDQVSKEREGKLLVILRSSVGNRDSASREFGRRLFDARKLIRGQALNSAAAQFLYELNEAETDELLFNAVTTLRPEQILWSFLAAHRRVSGSALFTMFRATLRKNGDETQLIPLLRGHRLETWLREDFRAEPLENLDRAWVVEAMSMKHAPLVAAIAAAGDMEAKEFLVRQVKNFPYETWTIEQAIFRIAPEAARDYLSEQLQALESRKVKAWEITSALAGAYGRFASSVTDFEKLGENLTGERKDAFDELVANARHKAANL